MPFTELWEEEDLDKIAKAEALGHGDLAHKVDVINAKKEGAIDWTKAKKVLLDLGRAVTKEAKQTIVSVQRSVAMCQEAAIASLGAALAYTRCAPQGIGASAPAKET